MLNYMRSLPKSEQEKAEMEAAERTDRRKGGFSLGKIRDRGWTRIRNHKGGEAIMIWHVDVPLEEGAVRESVPDGMFILKIGKEEAVFDLEEFKRAERWV